MEMNKVNYKDIQKKANNDLDRYNLILDYFKNNSDRVKANQDYIYSIQKEAVNGWCSPVYHKDLIQKHQSLLNKTNAILIKSIFNKK
jgi:hypothetical protein